MNLQQWVEQIQRREEALAAADNTADSARCASRDAGQTQIEASVVLAAAQADKAPEVIRAARRLYKAAKRAARAAYAAEEAARERFRQVRMDLVYAKACAWDAQASETAAQAVVEAAQAVFEQELTQEDLERALSGDLGFMNVDEDGYPAIAGGPIVW